MDPMGNFLDETHQKYPRFDHNVLDQNSQNSHNWGEKHPAFSDTTWVNV
jgi:hypothetical protein